MKELTDDDELDNLDLDNDSSCVLKVTAQGKSILLTGEIEKAAEKNLLEEDGKDLRADILVAPHHGSKTSADENFILAVNPTYVLFPVGYRNRYHFPNAKVVQKYQQLNVAQFDTVNDGAIQFKLAKGLVSRPVLYRSKNARYWF